MFSNETTSTLSSIHLLVQLRAWDDCQTLLSVFHIRLARINTKQLANSIFDVTHVRRLVPLHEQTPSARVRARASPLRTINRSFSTQRGWRLSLAACAKPLSKTTRGRKRHKLQICSVCTAECLNLFSIRVVFRRQLGSGVNYLSVRAGSLRDERRSCCRPYGGNVNVTFCTERH